MDRFSDFLLRNMFNQRDGQYTLSGFWYSIFRPINNRYYVGVKLYTTTFVIRYLPLTIVWIWAAAAENQHLLWLVVLALWVIAALIDFFILRKYEEKVTWKYLYSSQYG